MAAKLEDREKQELYWEYIIEHFKLSNMND